MKTPQFPLAALAALLVVSSGCPSASGPTRIPVSGKVTIKGQPSPGGTVMIRPAEGASGVAGSGVIIDGAYEFTSENGPQPGKYLLVVNLQDIAAAPRSNVRIPKPGGEPVGNPQGIELPGGKAEYIYEIEVPPEGAVVKDVEIN